MSRALLAALAIAALVVGPGATRSGADFTASSPSPSNTFTTAAEFNTVTAALADPGANLRGSVALSATAGSDRGLAAVRLRRAPAGTGAWTDICAAAACAWHTTLVADGLYDLQVEATDAAGYTRTATVAARRVDNTAPVVSIAPPPFVGGTASIAASASDAGSGVADVRIQRRAQGSATWTTVCTDATAPWACSWATAALPDGLYELRALARDRVGAETATGISTVRVDNTPAETTGDTPATGSGTVSLTASASDAESGIAHVAWEAFYGGVWYEFCRDTTAPYTCSGASTEIADGDYQVRTSTVNGAGVRKLGTAWTIRIDNTAPAAADVQAENGGAVGRLDAGDRLRLTWSEPVRPASLAAGWDGTARAVRVRVTTADRLDVLDADATTRLPVALSATDLALGADFVSADADFEATLTLAGATLTVTLGDQLTGTVETVAAPGTLSWRPASAVRDLAGNPASTALRSETGAADLDF